MGCISVCMHVRMSVCAYYVAIDCATDRATVVVSFCRLEPEQSCKTLCETNDRPKVVRKIRRIAAPNIQDQRFVNPCEFRPSCL